MLDQFEQKALVPEERVQSYLDENGMVIKRLPNGLTIVGIARNTPDSNTVNVNIVFPSGAHFDPPGKEGLLHIYEHLVAIEPLQVALRSDGNFNAVTKIHEMNIMPAGVANPDVLDYGYWPIMPAVYEELLAPKAPTIGRLDLEKSIVNREYFERTADKREVATRNFRFKAIFGPDHPTGRDITCPEGVASITPEDVADLYGRLLVPEGTYVKAYVDGPHELLEIVAQNLSENLSLMPKSQQPPLLFDHMIYGTVSNDFKPGTYYLHDDDSDNGNVFIEMFWNFPTNRLDPKSYALKELWSSLGNRFFKYVRERGYGYSAGASVFTLGNPRKETSITPRVIYLKTDKSFGNEDATARLISEIKENVIGTMTDDDLKQLLYISKRPILAKPISASDKLQDALTGLRLHGRPIDCRYDNEVLTSLTTDDLRYWIDRILDFSPAVILTGDLK